MTGVVTPSIAKRDARFSAASVSPVGRLWGTTFVVFFGIALALFLVEILFRVALPVLTPPRWNDRPRYFYVAPGANTLQDFNHLPQKSPNTYRILVVGDSFTFGPKLQFDDTFSKRLERILSMNDGPLKAEVLNFGVSGYSTLDELDLIKHAKEWNVDLVLLEITLNDPELQTLRARNGNAERFGPLVITRENHPVLHYWRSLGFVAQRLHAARTRRLYKEYFFDLFENPRTWAPFQAGLESIAQVRDQSNIPIRAVLFPLMSFSFDESYPFFAIHEKLRALCARLGIPMLDLFNVYRNIPPERLEVVPTSDAHPNEIAHRLAAEQIYSWLARESAIPQSLLISRASTIRENIHLYAEYDCAKHRAACFGERHRK